jgi:hypothetical protein
MTEWVTIGEDYLMQIIRCALFRDSWLGEEIDPFISGQLTPENQEKIRTWEQDAP